ncbi:MAG: nuclear transport factor 2 family protein, partial [Pseudomonadota bacterium]
KDWAKDMLWYGPTGIGATYTIERYQRQHQQPFRRNLSGKIFNGHIARFAEGNYCGWFGWPNLYNTNKGGFLGMPSGDTVAEMRVVDIYRRDGDKLAENWVFIDILHYLSVQGLDVLKRMADLNRKDYG